MATIMGLPGKINRLNSKIVPKFIKERIINEIVSDLNTNGFAPDLITIFREVKSPEIKQRIAMRTKYAIINMREIDPNLIFSIPIEVWDAEFVNNFFKEPKELLKIFEQKHDKHTRNKILDLLSPIRKDNLINYIKSDNYVSTTDIVNLISDLPEGELLDRLISSLPTWSISFLIESQELNVNLKNKLFREREEDIYKNLNFGDYINFEKYNKYLSSNMDIKIIEDIISHIDSKYLSDFIESKMISDSAKQKIMEMRNDEIAELSLLINTINNNGLDFEEIRSFIPRDKWELFTSEFVQIFNFLNSNLPNVNMFFKHAVFDNTDWFGLIDSMIKKGEVDNFTQISGKLLNKIYNVSSDNMMVVQSFIKLLKNYNRYPELCNNIANLDRDLTYEEKLQIEYLFDKDTNLENNIMPTKVEDLANITKAFNSQIVDVINNIEKYDASDIKNIICSTLFIHDESAIKGFMRMYGNTYELKKLKFNNKDNPEIFDLIDEMTIYVSIMEDIVNIDNADKDKLDQILRNISMNYDEISKISLFFAQFEQKMKHLYELESQVNLTKISSEKDYSSLRNEELTKKAGVEVLDFSDRQYALYAHVKSNRETVEELVNGMSSGRKNFISLSPISYRGQKYHSYDPEQTIIFGYSNLPSGNYICSSKKNMVTNTNIKPNSNEVEQAGEISNRTQRGILECSDNGLIINPEAFCFREGLKPSCIILPKGGVLTNEIIDIARTNGLKIVLTQGVKERIDNPKPIPSEKSIEEKKNNAVDELKNLKDQLLSAKAQSGPRKIAILSDAHGLFEPTLAVLEDARKSGISEVYSLGDNIGTGPNPGEVVDLLSSYGVKSVKGNHELYTLLGTEPFKDHLRATDATEEAQRNSSWTRAKLTKGQLETIRKYPDQIELTIGGKKVLLRHYIKDFNTNNVVVNPENYDKIFQGHIHFANQEENIDTLRGAGIGYHPNDPNKGNAYYIVITERADGGFDIERKEVNFDLNNLGHNINASDLDTEDKNKIAAWTGTRSSRR